MNLCWQPSLILETFLKDYCLKICGYVRDDRRQKSNVYGLAVISFWGTIHERMTLLKICQDRNEHNTDRQRQSLTRHLDWIGLIYCSVAFCQLFFQRLKIKRLKIKVKWSDRYMGIVLVVYILCSEKNPLFIVLVVYILCSEKIHFSSSITLRTMNLAIANRSRVSSAHTVTTANFQEGKFFTGSKHTGHRWVGLFFTAELKLSAGMKCMGHRCAAAMSYLLHAEWPINRRS